MEKTKICITCKEEKLATTKYFYKSNSNKDGLVGQCIKCKKAYDKVYRSKRRELDKQYRKDNKERISNYMKKWRKENKDHRMEYQKEWKEVNKDRVAIHNKRYYEENKEEIAEWGRQYNIDNREVIAMRSRKYRKNNPEVVRRGAQNYRAKKKELPSTLTRCQWDTIKTDFNNECSYCGMTEPKHLELWKERLHQEHFIPLRSGGGYTHNNIIPACRSCNSSKNDKDFFEWYPNYEHYSREREQFILEYLGYTDNTQQLALF